MWAEGLMSGGDNEESGPMRKRSAVGGAALIGTPTGERVLEDGEQTHSGGGRMKRMGMGGEAGSAGMAGKTTASQFH